MIRFRNVIIVMMLFSFVLGITACGERPDQQQTETDIVETEIQEPEIQVIEESELAGTESQRPGKDTLVVYFSATGTTEAVAKKIAGITDADIYEIVPAIPYSQEDLNYSNSQSRATLEMNNPDVRPEIGSGEISLAGYTTLYIGYPIWWGEAPRIVSTFVEHYNFDGMTVIPFCTSGSSGIGNSGRQLAEQSGSGTWISGSRWNGNVSEADLQTWISDL